MASFFLTLCDRAIRLIIHLFTLSKTLCRLPGSNDKHIRGERVVLLQHNLKELCSLINYVQIEPLDASERAQELVSIQLLSPQIKVLLPLDTPIGKLVMKKIDTISELVRLGDTGALQMEMNNLIKLKQSMMKSEWKQAMNDIKNDQISPQKKQKLLAHYALKKLEE